MTDAADRARLGATAGDSSSAVRDVARHLRRYPEFFRRSRAEFTVAKDQNVRLRSGWFSERDACYLASGKPVIAQDTGLREDLPTGRGPVRLPTMDEAVGSGRCDQRDYRRHCGAARAVAEEYFEARRWPHACSRTSGSVESGRDRPPRCWDAAGRTAGVRICSGYLVRHPVGGLSWHHLQYLVGFRQLGHEVTFVEDYGWPNSCYDPARNVMTSDPSYGIAYARHLMRRFALDESWCYLAENGTAYGLSRAQLADVCAGCDLYVNLSNVNWIPELEQCRRRVLVDTDPVFTQIGAHGIGPPFSWYDARFTYGENVHRSGPQYAHSRSALAAYATAGGLGSLADRGGRSEGTIDQRDELVIHR